MGRRKENQMEIGTDGQRAPKMGYWLENPKELLSEKRMVSRTVKVTETLKETWKGQH
jgi:hypothetical protein